MIAARTSRPYLGHDPAVWATPDDAESAPVQGKGWSAPERIRTSDLRFRSLSVIRAARARFRRVVRPRCDHSASADHPAHLVEGLPERVRVVGHHREHRVPGDRRQVGVIDARGAQVRDVAVAHLVRAHVEPGALLRRVPHVAVEVALAPQQPARASGTAARVSMRAGIARSSSRSPGGHGTTRPGAASPWSVLVPCRIAPSCAVRTTCSTPSRRSERRSGRTSPRRRPVSAKVRTIGSYRPAAAAKRCICSNENTRVGRGPFDTRGSFARTRTPRNGFTSTTSSVIASSAISPSARTMCIAPRAERPLLAQQRVEERQDVAATQLAQRPVAAAAGPPPRRPARATRGARSCPGSARRAGAGAATPRSSRRPSRLPVHDRMPRRSPPAPRASSGTCPRSGAGRARPCSARTTPPCPRG